MTQSELHRPIPLHRIGPHGLDVTVEASDAECAALAQRMRLPAVHSLTCRFHLERDGDTRVAASGELQARVTQTCVVTLEDFDAPVEETFQVLFVPAGEESEEIELEAEDEIPYEGTSIDLGEAAAEQLGLALDPYPKMPGAELPEPEPEAEDNPFSAIAGLKRLN